MKKLEIVIIAERATPGLQWTIQRVITHRGHAGQAVIRSETASQSEMVARVGEILQDSTENDLFFILVAANLDLKTNIVDEERERRVLVILPALSSIPSKDFCFGTPFDSTSELMNWLTRIYPKAVLVNWKSSHRERTKEIAASFGHSFIDIDDLKPDSGEEHSPKAIIITDTFAGEKAIIIAIERIQKAGFEDIVLLGVYPDFDPGGYQALIATGIRRIVTCHTISHESNVIDIAPLIIEQVIPTSIKRL